MIYDMESLFSDAQAITATANGTNVIDLGVAQTPMHGKAPIGQDPGKGRPIQLRIQVVEAFNNLTSLTAAVVISDNADLSSPETIVAESQALAGLVPGYTFAPQFLPQNMTKRYVGITYTVSGTNPTTGKITAGLVFGNEHRNV